MNILTTPQNKLATTSQPVFSLIKSRWSPRVFADRKLSEEAVTSLFEAARWAPSSSNMQPWRFIYAQKGDEGYQKLFDSMGAFNQSWAGNAPMLLATFYNKKMPNGKENFHGPHDLGLAMGNLTIQAQSMGIALHQMAGFDWKKIADKFDVLEDFHPTTMVAIGFYGGDAKVLPDDLEQQEKKDRERKSLESIVGKGFFPK